MNRGNTDQIRQHWIGLETKLDDKISQYWFMKRGNTDKTREDRTGLY